MLPAGDTLGVAMGGTGATTAAGARTNLGLGSMATQSAGDFLPIAGGTVLGNLGVNGSFFTRDVVYLGGGAGNTLDKLRVINAGSAVRVDAVDAAASVFKPLYFQATGYSFGGSGLATFDGSLRANGMFSYAGTFATQAGVLARGWSNGVTRWLDVLENDASMSLYSYNTAGASSTQVFNFKSAVAGGLNRCTYNGELWAVGMRTHTWAGTPTNGVVYFGTGDSYIYKNGASFAFVNVEGGYTANLVSGGNILTSGAAINVTGAVSTLGASASLSFQERDDFSSKWDWYASSGVARLWRSGYGDRMQVTYQGNVATTGNIDAGALSANIGRAALITAEAGRTGFLAFYRSTGQRAGYIGYGAAGASRILMQPEDGMVGWSIAGDALFNSVTYFNSTMNMYWANSAGYTRIPRIFVGGGDPGAAAADGDIWVT